MEKKTSKTRLGIQLTFVIVFFAVLCIPLTLMAISGPDDYDKEALQETEACLVPLNLTTYSDGTFHSAFEKWFSKNYPLRSKLVTLYSWLKMELENTNSASSTMTLFNSLGNVYRPTGVFNPSGTNSNIPVEYMELYLNPDNMYAEMNAKRFSIVPQEPTGFKGHSDIYIGKSNYLFQSDYINEYLGLTDMYTSITQEGVQTTVDKLEYIQRELEKRYGITMIFVITPSKASYCAEFIPDHYVNKFTLPENYVRPVDMMRECLASSTVNYLDSIELYRDLGLISVFPKTGIHWNHVASFLTTARIMQMYSELTGETVKLPKTEGVLASPNPIQTGNSDVDLYNLLYGAISDASSQTKDDEYYYPIVSVDNKDAPEINVFVQGGSFTCDIVYYMEAYNLGETRRIHYNGTFVVDYWDKNADPWTSGIYAWEEILTDYDLIVFEQNEQYVRGEHITDGDWSKQAQAQIGSNAVYDSLYEYLKASE